MKTTCCKLIVTCSLLLASAAPLFGQGVADTNRCVADYRNTVYDPAYTGGGCSLTQAGSVAFFSGNVGGATNDLPGSPNIVRPNDRVNYLVRSVIGQPIGGVAVPVPGQTFKFGAPIIAEASLGVDDRRAPAQIDPPFAAVFIAGPNRVFATASGFVTIDWYRPDGSVNSPVTYYIEVDAVQEPVRLYLTENGTNSTGAPTVDVSSVSVTPHYNQAITAAVLTNVAGRLHATGGTGKVLLEYRDKSAPTNFLGVEILDIRSFVPDSVLPVDVGAWLQPNTNRSSIPPLASRGLPDVIEVKDGQTNVLSPHFAYQYTRAGDAHDGQVFAVRPTSANDQIELFWFRTNLASVVWPYEMDRYTADWPADFEEQARRIYLTKWEDETPTEAPTVSIPGDKAPKVVFHYNDAIPPAGGSAGALGYLWLDSTTRELNAKGRTGRILLHYEQPTNPGFIGLQFVDVRPYLPDIIDAWFIGDRLMPEVDVYPETHLLKPQVSYGLQKFRGELDKGPAYVYQHGTAGPMDGFTFATRRTTAADQIELFWFRYGLRDVAWPYEMHRYQADWPPVARRDKYQRYVRGSTAVLGPSVSVPPNYNLTLMDWQEPPGHAGTPDNDTFRSFTNGWALLRYTPTNEVHFQVVHSVLHNDPSEFDLSLHPAPIGTEILDPSHQGPQPGYIHVLDTQSPKENRYDWETYDGVPNDLPPDAGLWTSATDWDPAWTTKQIFPVNVGQLEVWWSNTNQGVQWPSLVKRYDSVWPANPEEIVIASQSGSGGIGENAHQHFRVYYQDDPTQPGFNPNDEHAFKFEGANGWAIFALRDDLETPTTSKPYVLLKYQNPAENDRWRFRVFKVMAENDKYRFSYANYDPPAIQPDAGKALAMGLQAGQLVQPPFPVGYLNFLEYCTENTDVSGPYWADRKTNYWARSAGDWGSRAEPTNTVRIQAPTNIVMRFFYSTNTGLIPGLYFPPDKPALRGRDVASHVAWLDRRPGGTPGVPTDITYKTIWPEAPTLRFGETLVKSKFGLPDIAGMKSVEIIYQQSLTNGTGESVKLIDPTRAFSVPLAQPPADIQVSQWGGQTWFPTLPPQLRTRLWYDDVQHTLNFKGQLVEPVAGEYYLLLNVITAREKEVLLGLSGDAAFRTAINKLSQKTNVVEVPPNVTFDSLALTAGLAKGGGYVTIVENNSTNLALNLLADPVAPHVIYVECPLYRGELKVIASDNQFDEQITLRHSADLAGKADQYVFDWRTLPPHDGLPPASPYDAWPSYTPQPSSGQGAIDITIGGPGLYTLTDNYFVCRYGTTNLVGGCTDNLVGTTNWSAWTSPMLAEGWIKRVLAGINPFDQRIKDFRKTQVNTIVSMISQAGPRSEGAVALNADQANNYGLIEIYETVLNRGIGFSIGAGFNYGPANDALLLAATRIADLYMLLGNEAYADASDPTIAYGTDSSVGIEASSIHCFQNQTASLLDEELALLRGRDDTLLPSPHTSPFYNRLIWNFTQSDGEVAYVSNYDIRDEVSQDPNTGAVDPTKKDGLITEADAKVDYPQGHGDAWGHYLSALKGYYRLLRNPYFTWVPRIEAVVVGGVPVSVDYEDERKFAKAAALQAQTGAEIVNLTYRSQYVEDPGSQFQGYPDPRTNRVWGVSDWAERAGQGAFFDWVMANALLPAEYHESYRLTDAAVSDIGKSATYLLTPALITNSIPPLTSGISPNAVRSLLPLADRPFFGRDDFVAALDGAIGATDRIRYQTAILSVAQTAGLPELVFQALDLLKGKQFPSMELLAEAFRQNTDAETADRYFASDIQPHVTVPSDTPVEGIQKIDRGTVTELRDIASAYVSIQDQMDKADLGLNPLGLVKNAIPFDIDPDLLADSTKKQTHFEQIYARAVDQMNNAIAVFNHAVNASQKLRQQSDTLADFKQTVEEREADFNNRLIEIFGYPYADDVGPTGTYPQGYDGPDLFHYMYSDLSQLTGEMPANISVVEFTVTNRSLTIGDNGGVTQAEPRLVKYHLDRNSFGFVKPPTWTGTRRAPGDIQKNHSLLLQAKSRFDRSLIEYDNLLSQIEDQTELLHAQYGLNAQEINVLNAGKGTQENLNDRIKRSRVRQTQFRWVSDKARMVASALAECVPKLFGFIGGLANGFTIDIGASIRGAILFAGNAASEASRVQADRETIVELDEQQAKEEAQLQNNIVLTTLRQEQGILQQLAQIEQLVRQEPLLRLEMFTQQEGLQQAEGDYASALARGQRLLEDRLRFRQQTAGKIQEYRYKDMAFRIFRNDAIQKYRAQFDTAAMYVYLAAKAYDYETNLKPGDPAHPGSYFMNQIARARTIGIIGDNGPQTGAQGDAGLADPMARMIEDFKILKPQLGLNNPQPESLEFSLKSELMRVLPGTNSTAAWREALARARVADLSQVPEVRQYCLFENTNVEPGLVIEFPTTVNKGLNNYGWPYGAGDSRFNDTAFATKIRAVGLSFSNYRITGPGGMAKTPYAYLVPVGSDVMRSPRRYVGDTINDTRQWKIMDQWLPVPFRLSDKNDAKLADQSWIPIYSVAEGSAFQLGDVRGHNKFRVWHDNYSSIDPDLKPTSPVMLARRLVSRSVWNTKWLLIIPAADLGGSTPAEYEESLNRFIYGGLVNGVRDGQGVSDIRLRIEAGSFSGR